LSLNTPQRSSDAWIRLLIAPHTASITQKRQIAENLSSRSADHPEASSSETETLGRLNGRQRIHGTLIVHYRFAHMSLLEIVTHVEALIFAAFGILISLSGIASLWAFRKIGRLAS
jgi:hypothetical protein